MSVVLPPLHQDFRAGHTRFCSPGDGWPAFIPPPPPNVPPAFHFCSVLLDPEAYAPSYNPWLKQPKPRAPLDARLHGACAGALKLPAEILGQILRYAIADGMTGPNLIRSSRLLRNVTLPHLYRDVRLKKAESIELFAQCLDAHPERASLVRQLHIETHRVDWTAMNKIAKHLANVDGNIPASDGTLQAKRIESLTIAIQASDLHLAGEFLASFTPKAFKWQTSPCWLMRPANLYCKFLARWPRLKYITLEGFRFDEVLAECLSVVPTLKEVTLAGKGCQHLDVASLYAFLQHAPPAPASPLPLWHSNEDSNSFPKTSTSPPSLSDEVFLSGPPEIPYKIQIADCPKDRQALLTAELHERISRLRALRQHCTNFQSGMPVESMDIIHWI